MEGIWKEFQIEEDSGAEGESMDGNKKDFTLRTLFWIYMAGGVLGCFLETLWCRLALGGWESRSSNLFFPVSSVWGIGTVLFSIVLSHGRERCNRSLFIKGYLLGGMFEFLCGIVCEKLLGVTFWDYTFLPLTLGRYVNLIFCCFWGFTAIFWARKVYPCLRQGIAGMLDRKWKLLTRCLMTYILATTLLSGIALLRMEERNSGVPAGNRIENYLDEHYPDEILQKFFPKMKPL